MDNPRHGLYRLMDSAQKQKIQVDLSVLFADLYDSLAGIRDLIRQLHDTLDDLLDGEAVSF